MKFPGKGPQIARLVFKDRGLLRAEPDVAGGPVSIVDTVHGQTLILDPAQKSAILLVEQTAQGRAPNRDFAAGIIEDMRRLANKNGEPAGEQVIGDLRARGFRVKEHGQEMTVWIDPAKRLPVLVEVTGRVGDMDFQATFADIQLEPKVDENLFKLDPPAGYALRKAGAKLMMSFEEAAARLLRTYGEAQNGAFPPRIDDFNAYKEAFSKKQAKSALDPEGFEIAAAAATVAALTQKMKDQYGYKVDGVKLGAGDKIIFWYKPEGQTKYRVIYGDLHLGEVSADQLPEKPK
jgi:hypothetical protein